MQMSPRVLLPLLAAVALTARSGTGVALEPPEPIAVREAWIAQPPPGTEVLAGYLELEAHQDDRLRAATSTFAGRIEIHAHSHVDGVMQMRQLRDGVALPAGEVVRFEPHGLHLMLFDPEHRPAIGERIQIGLDFAQAGQLLVEFEVRDGRVE